MALVRRKHTGEPGNMGLFSEGPGSAASAAPPPWADTGDAALLDANELDASAVVEPIDKAYQVPSRTLDRETYVTSEAASLLGVAVSSLNLWLDGRAHGGEVVQPELRDAPRPSVKPKKVTWGEFVEAGHLAAWRCGDRLPLRHLRAYSSWYRSRVEAEQHPLARPLPPHQLRDRRIAGLLDRRRIQSVNAFFARLDFHEGVPVRYWPMGRDTLVVVDPLRQGGAPTIPGTRVTTAVLHGMHSAGDSVESIARYYSLSTRQIGHAVLFEQHLADGVVTAALLG